MTVRAMNSIFKGRAAYESFFLGQPQFFSSRLLRRHRQAKPKKHFWEEGKGCRVSSKTNFSSRCFQYFLEMWEDAVRVRLVLSHLNFPIDFVDINAISLLFGSNFKIVSKKMQRFCGTASRTVVATGIFPTYNCLLICAFAASTT